MSFWTNIRQKCDFMHALFSSGLITFFLLLNLFSLFLKKYDGGFFSSLLMGKSCLNQWWLVSFFLNNVKILSKSQDQCFHFVILTLSYIILIEILYIDFLYIENHLQIFFGNDFYHNDQFFSPINLIYSGIVIIFLCNHTTLIFCIFIRRVRFK